MSLPRFQFSLFRLLILVTVVAVLLFLATKVGSFIGVLLFSFVVCIVPTPLVICAIYGQRDARAFSIGALVPWVVAIALRFPESPERVWGMIWLLLMGIICGALAVATRWWIQ